MLQDNSRDNPAGFHVMCGQPKVGVDGTVVTVSMRKKGEIEEKSKKYFLRQDRFLIDIKVKNAFLQCDDFYIVSYVF